MAQKMDPRGIKEEKAFKQEKEIVGAETIPPPPRVNSLQALTRLRAKKGCEWCTFAFVLNRDMIKEDGTLDDLHAVVFPLGAFSEQKQAEDHAKNVIAITGHPIVVAAPYGSPVKLSTTIDPALHTEVRVENGRILELEDKQYNREQEEYERRVKQEQDLVKEANEETDPNSIEHFKRQAYLAIKNRASYLMHTRQAESAMQNYKKREEEVRKHFAQHPEHERDWLPYLKQKLAERGEMSLYNGVEAAYLEIRDELLGLSKDESKCSDDVCPIDEESDDEIISPEEMKQ